MIKKYTIYLDNQLLTKELSRNNYKLPSNEVIVKIMELAKEIYNKKQKISLKY